MMKVLIAWSFDHSNAPHDSDSNSELKVVLTARTAAALSFADRPYLLGHIAVISRLPNARSLARLFPRNSASSVPLAGNARVTNSVYMQSCRIICKMIGKSFWPLSVVLSRMTALAQLFCGATDCCTPICPGLYCDGTVAKSSKDICSEIQATMHDYQALPVALLLEKYHISQFHYY